MQGDLSSAQLIELVDYPINEITSALTFLEVAGLIERLPGKMYSLKND